MEKKLLRKIPASKEKAEASIKAANKWLREAEKSQENEAFNSSVIASYLTMFHSARSILFLDGIRERSHFCIARYLEEKYVKGKLLEDKWTGLLDHYRELRHNDQYSTSFFATEEEATKAIKSSKEFLDRMVKLLKVIQNNQAKKDKKSKSTTKPFHSQHRPKTL